MTDEQAFLNALKANPADDTTRLVYADWLDEHGDPLRAEFIRVQCELATGRGEYPARKALWVRQWDLLVIAISTGRRSKQVRRLAQRHIGGRDLLAADGR